MISPRLKLVAVISALYVLVVYCAGASENYFLTTSKTGVYRLRFEDLAGYISTSSDFSKIEITRGGTIVAHWFEDVNSDGEFGTGDALEFVVPPPSGGQPHPADTVTILRFSSGDSTSSMGRVEPASPLTSNTSTIEPRIKCIVEKNLHRTAFSLPDFSQIDHGYWERLSPLDDEAFHFDLSESEQWVAAKKSDITVNVRLRGATWANFSARDFQDHAIKFETENMTRVQEWSGKNATTLSLPEIAFDSRNSHITLHVPPRTSPSGEFLADVVFLNWLEWEAPILPEGLLELDSALPLSTEGHIREESNEALKVTLPPSNDRFQIYSSSGVRWDFPASGGEFGLPSISDKWFLLVRDSLKLNVDSVRLQKPTEFEIPKDDQSSYLFIAPQFLAAGAKKLAAIHRDRGLSTQVVTIEQIRDSYGGDSVSQEAIQRTIQDWFSSRPNKTENYVLLIGDASWESPGTGRNIIPTTAQLINGSLCASDNPYACVSGDDLIPDLALGRLPVASAEEFESIYSKIENFFSQPRPSDSGWETLWIVDQNRFHQNLLQSSLGGSEHPTLSSEFIFAEEGEDNSARLDRIRKAVAHGYNMVFYQGHGSRHVWRTGVADFSGQSSIFDSDDIDAIAAREDAAPARVVFSSSCDNAPFDHSEDDSLGERFLLAPRAGSLCFIGASWRIINSPRPLRSWVSAILDARNETIGQSFLAMKQSIDDPRLIASFNLLGDPAIPLKDNFHRDL